MGTVIKTRENLHRRAEKARLRGLSRETFESWSRKNLIEEINLVGEKCFYHILSYSFDGAK